MIYHLRLYELFLGAVFFIILGGVGWRYLKKMCNWLDEIDPDYTEKEKNRKITRWLQEGGKK